MRLFEVIPGNFFSLLSSRNREIYYDALMILHNMFKYDLNIRMDDYLATLVSYLEERRFEYEPEEGDDIQAVGSTGDKARLILDRLVKTGWVEREYMDNSFVEIITPRNYAIPVIKLLSELGEEGFSEYNSLVFATYSGLKQAMSENESSLYEAVLSAEANTENLRYSLRALYHGIRGFLRGIAEQNDVNTLLEEHFNDYIKMSDRVYHPIKTMDSVHRYAVPIQTALADILADEKRMRSICERAVSVRRYADESQARDAIVRAIDYVMDAYQTIGGLVSEIDRKHSMYTKRSIEKIRYQMNADQSIRGKLADILGSYARLSEAPRERLADAMETGIRAGRQEFFDARSPYHKSARSRRVEREPLAVEPRADLSGLEEDYLLRQIRNGYSSARIRAFVNGLFADGSSEIESKDIPVTCDSDFIMLILAVIRRNERGTPYVMELRDGRADRNGYVIPNMTIRKKTAGK